jgi:hypothetical protein
MMIMIIIIIIQEVNMHEITVDWRILYVVKV